MKPGQIVIVNGTSGSGKSTTCELLAKQSSDFWLLYGIDHFLAGTLPAQFGHHGPRCREGIYAHPVDEQNPNGPLRWSLGRTAELAGPAAWLAGYHCARHRIARCSDRTSGQAGSIRSDIPRVAN